MQKLLLFLFLVVSFGNLCAQNNDVADFEAQPTSINEVVRGLGADTVVFYYNQSWQMVKPVCATVFRISRIDTVLFMFTGPFVDYHAHDSSIAVEGTYVNGKKEGLFNIYFPNGQLEQSGNYVNDRKSGLWAYFYPDGTRHQTLDFQYDDVLVKEFWNEEGKQLVAAGNGEWFGYDSPERFIKTSGAVLNGRKNGNWKNVIVSRHMTTIIEKYKEGKLVSGKMFSIARGIDLYNDTIFCSIEKPPAFLNAELFQVNRCFKMEKNTWQYATYPGGMERFYRQIKERMVINGPLFKRGVMKIDMTIAADGKMTNLKPVTNIGHEFELIRVLETMDKWTPTKVNGKPTVQQKIIGFAIW